MFFFLSLLSSRQTMVRARLGGALRRRGAMARAALAAALVLGMLPLVGERGRRFPPAGRDPHREGGIATGGAEALGRCPRGAREQDAEHGRREGTLALGGTFALVIRDDALPALPPTNPAFTIAMRVFLTHDPTHDAYVGLFWKGRGNDDRTPSAWLAPGSTLVTFRVSTTVSTEVWGTGVTPLPVREWCHIALSVDGRIMRFYVNGVLIGGGDERRRRLQRWQLTHREGPRQPWDFGVPGRGADARDRAA